MRELEGARDAALRDLDTEAQKVAAPVPTSSQAWVRTSWRSTRKIRTQSGGLAAAPLRQRRCGGCQLELNNVDMSRIKAAPSDEVLRCEECRRILVRTAESGL